MKGTVKWYNTQKGFGFITGDDGQEVFVHRTDIPEGTYLHDDDQVEYQIEKTDKGPRAINIKKA